MNKDQNQFFLKLKVVFGGKGQILMSYTNYHQLEKENKLVLSYLTVCKIIGILGFFFPLILVLGSFLFGGCTEIQNSISNYYHTNMRDVFVGYVGTLSILLFSYKGYDIIDRIVSGCAGIFGTIVALMPMALRDPLPNCNIVCTVQTYRIIHTIHLISAALFILSMAYFTLFLFTKGETRPTPEKRIRNKIYHGAGYIMLTCIAFLILFFLIPDHIHHTLLQYKPAFWLETIAFVAFGFSWLVKGGVFFKDE